MAKTGYRKFKKQENSKVKLKASKKLLPKGQNVTDTNFKVKKIVIRDQVHEHKVGEFLNKKNLNCQVSNIMIDFINTCHLTIEMYISILVQLLK